jgi:hypothetical protein
MMTTKEAMNTNNQAAIKDKLSFENMRCATCGIRKMAESNPNSIMSRIWKWHTGWCPGWNAYQNALAEAAK